MLVQAKLNISARLDPAQIFVSCPDNDKLSQNNSISGLQKGKMHEKMPQKYMYICNLEKEKATVLTEPQKLAGNPIELCCQHCKFVAVSNLSQVRKGLG